MFYILCLLSFSFLAAPVIDIEDKYLICDNNSIVIDAGNEGALYEWRDLADNAIMGTSRTLEVKQAGSYRLTVTMGSESAFKNFYVVESFTPVINIDSKTYAICVGSTITFDAGNEGASFLWVNNNSGDTISQTQFATISFKGIYTVVATTPCGTSLKSVVVEEIGYPDLKQVPSIGYLCEGGTSTIDAKNFDSKAAWVSTISGDTIATTKSATFTKIGDYQLILYNQCDTVSKIVQIVPRKFPILTLEAEKYICDNGTVMLDAGNEGAEYEWVNVQTKAVISNAQIVEVDKVGKYSLKTIDPCGVVFDTVEVFKSQVPVLDLKDQYVICGDAAETIFPNLFGMDYEWKNNDEVISTEESFTPNSPGDYTLTVTNGCGSDNESFTVIKSFVPENLIKDEFNVVSLNGSHTLDAGNEGANFVWIEVSTGTILSENQTLEVKKSGEYILNVTTLCGGFDKLFNINLITGLGNENKIQNHYTIFPNPASQFLNIKFHKDKREQTTISLSDLSGKILFKVINNEVVEKTNFISFDLAKVPQGVYILKIEGKEAFRTKLVVN